MMLGTVSVMGVIVAAVAAMIVGMAWYSKAICGGAWMRASCMTDAAKEQAAKAGMTGTMVWGFASQLVRAYVLAYFIALLGVSGWQEGATIGAWLWLGFAATGIFSCVLWERKPANYFWINAGHELVSLAVMGAILASW